MHGQNHPPSGQHDPLVAGAQLSQRLYTDPTLFRLEMERIFATAWIYLGHECQITTPGSYFLGHMGLVSVIVVRDRKEQIVVLENRCAHRGAAVCTELTGTATVFTCPYHGWSYGLNGDLRGMPLAGDYAGSFPKEHRGLKAVPRVASYRGFIFASMAAEGPTLEEFLGAAKLALDDFMDRAPEGTLVIADEVPLRHRYRGNWKIQFENLNDFLHPGFAHASAMEAAGSSANSGNDSNDGIVDVISGFKEFSKKLQSLTSIITPYGHSYIPGFAKLSGTFVDADRQLKEVLAKTHGETRAAEIVDTDIWVALIYPSLIIKPGNQNLRIIRPLAHDETEITMHSFRMPGAPKKVFDEAHDYYRLLGSPASPILADDLVIYEMVQADYGRDYTISAERGYGQMLTAESGEPRIAGTSEEYIRTQYRVWQQYLQGEL